MESEAKKGNGEDGEGVFSQIESLDKGTADPIRAMKDRSKDRIVVSQDPVLSVRVQVVLGIGFLDEGAVVEDWPIPVGGRREQAWIPDIPSSKEITGAIAKAIESHAPSCASCRDMKFLLDIGLPLPSQFHLEDAFWSRVTVCSVCCSDSSVPDQVTAARAHYRHVTIAGTREEGNIEESLIFVSGPKTKGAGKQWDTLRSLVGGMKLPEVEHIPTHPGRHGGTQRY